MSRLLSVRKQYHFWRWDNDLDAWDADRLIELSCGLSIEPVAVDSIAEVDTAYWFDGSAEVPTVCKVVGHTKLIMGVDLSYPVILGHHGRVMDGMHQIARAPYGRKGGGRRHSLHGTVGTDDRGCQSHELPY